MLFSNIENTLFILIDKNINILIITFTNTLLQWKVVPVNIIELTSANMN